MIKKGGSVLALRNNLKHMFLTLEESVSSIIVFKYLRILNL